MTEREFERKMNRQYPREELIKEFCNAYRAGFLSVFGNKMTNSAKRIMKSNIALIR